MVRFSQILKRIRMFIKSSKKPMNTLIQNKIYVFILTLPLFIAPSYALEVPDDEILLDNAAIVAELGWSKANPSLKIFFDEYGIEFINTYTKSSPSACKMPNLDEMSDSDLNISTYINTNTYALAYARYLESREESDSALLVYKYILKQSTLCAHEELNMLDLIYLIVVERSAIESLSNALKSDKYNLIQRQAIRSFLERNLLLNTHTFSKALTNERLDFNSYCGSTGVLSDYATAKFKEACIRTDQKNSLYYKRINKVSTQEQADKLTTGIEKDKEAFMLVLQNRYPNLIDVDTREIEESIKLIDVETLSDLLFYVSLIDYSMVKIRLLEQIDENKEFLTTLP